LQADRKKNIGIYTIKRESADRQRIRKHGKSEQHRQMCIITANLVENLPVNLPGKSEFCRIPNPFR
jgi:hypothetical protein